MLSRYELLALTALFSASLGSETFKGPQIIGSGKLTAADIKAGKASTLKPECDFSSDGLGFHWVAFEDQTCVGWNHENQCLDNTSGKPKAWSFCDTSLALKTMYDQVIMDGAHASAKLGNWIGAFEGNTRGFSEEDVPSFDEAIVIANNHAPRNIFSSDTFNEFTWEDSAGATTYYWGSHDSNVASITRAGQNLAEYCTPVSEEICERLKDELSEL